MDLWVRRARKAGIAGGFCISRDAIFGMNSGWHEHRNATGGYGIRIRLQAFARSPRRIEFSWSCPINRLVAYQTSKFGLCGFTLSLRIDYCRENFGVTLLCRGFVRTPMLEKSIDRDTGEAPALLPDWLCTTPEKVARKAIGAIKKNKGLVLITPLARLAWWSMRLSPRLYEWRRRGGWRSHAD
jgi:NAD(P)-dependent dehydrogenase (short-subunit alcohol dehydrogenase family)